MSAALPNSGWRMLVLVALLVVATPPTRCGMPAAQVQRDAATRIPAQSDWTDYGLILSSGALGEWDYQLWGGFAGTAVKRDGTYYLYYQGAQGYRTTGDETVTWRAIGVATSPDGINFTKYGSNPVLTWFPNDAGEEGAVSGAAILDDSGGIVLYYGANTARSAAMVNADVRLAVSPDGVSFVDRGIALDHRDGAVWGSRDELFPIIAIHDAGRWFVYYLPNGSLQSRKLGVAWGNDRNQLTYSSGVFNGLASVQAWGMGGSAKISADAYALFLNDVTTQRTEVRIVSLRAPNQLSAPVTTYQFDDVTQATFLHDEEAHTWFMYYRDENAYGVMLAAAGEPDSTPPTAPGSVTATPVTDREIDLSWSPATDPDTGIVLYSVYRDTQHLATVKGWSYNDTGLIERTTYTYTVSAVNYHGVEGPQSSLVSITTLTDTTPPRIKSVNAGGPSNQVTVVFDEPVEASGAETVANYTIDRGVSVTRARLSTDHRTVVLTTSPLRHDTTYQIVVSTVRDRAQAPNTITPGTAVRFTHSRVPGLVGAWTFDEGQGETAFDTANYGNHGALIYTAVPGPAWTDGRAGYALRFDGIDDQVTIDGAGSLDDITGQSHTFVAWALPDGVPLNATPNNSSFSVLVRDYTGLYYDHTGRFRAQIRLADGTEVAVSSEVMSPGSWHHLTMGVDVTEMKLWLYVDGIEVSSSPADFTGPFADHHQAPYFIGTSDPLTERYECRFSGMIDGVRIYDRALDPLEIQGLISRSPLSSYVSSRWASMSCGKGPFVSTTDREPGGSCGW